MPSRAGRLGPYDAAPYSTRSRALCEPLVATLGHAYCSENCSGPNNPSCLPISIPNLDPWRSGGALRRTRAGRRGRPAHQDGIDVVRLGYADLIGTERGRDLLVNRFARTVADGVAFCRSIYGTSPLGDVIDIEGGLAAGLPDVVAFPDLSTLQPVPWEKGVAHCIADVSTRTARRRRRARGRSCERVVERFAAARHAADRRARARVLRPGARPRPGRRLAALRRGQRQRLRLRPAGATRRTSAPDRCASSAATASRSSRPTTSSASGQFEINLWHSEALDAADRALRFKAAVKELSRWWASSRPSWPSRSTTRAAPASTCTSPPGTTTARRCSTTRAQRTGCPRSHTTPSPASSPTLRRWPRCTTRRSTPTSDSARTRSRRG